VVGVGEGNSRVEEAEEEAGAERAA